MSCQNLILLFWESAMFHVVFYHFSLVIFSRTLVFFVYSIALGIPFVLRLLLAAGLLFLVMWVSSLEI